MAKWMDSDKPSSERVADFHANADTDAGNTAIHHTLGGRAGQAAPGNHTHNGNDSPQLLGGVEITGSTTEAQMSSIINALVRLGAEDKTSSEG